MAKQLNKKVRRFGQGTSTNKKGKFKYRWLVSSRGNLIEQRKYKGKPWTKGNLI